MFLHGRKQTTHRIAWQFAYGEIPDGLFVLHKCDNKLCVNVSHLFLGTNEDNIHDMVKKRRHSHGEKHRFAKLSEREALEIKRMVKGGTLQREAGKKYGILQPAVSRIVNGHNWGHLSGSNNT